MTTTNTDPELDNEENTIDPSGGPKTPQIAQKVSKFGNAGFGGGSKFGKGATGGANPASKQRVGRGAARGR